MVVKSDNSDGDVDSIDNIDNDDDDVVDKNKVLVLLNLDAAFFLRK